MNPVDQLLLDSLVMQLELGRMKKPNSMITTTEASGPVIDMDEDDAMSEMFHEMSEFPEIEVIEMNEEEEEEEGEKENADDQEMAVVELNAIMDKVNTIIELVQSKSELPAWVQAKITLAAHDVTAVHDYLKYRNCR